LFNLVIRIFAGIFLIQEMIHPAGPGSGDYKVLRGSDWYYDWDSLRVANRDYNFPDLRNVSIGFRCAAPPAN